MARFTLFSRDRPFAGIEYVVQLLWVRLSAFYTGGHKSAGPSTTDLTDSDILDQTEGRQGVISAFGLEYARDVRRRDEGFRWSPDSHYVARVAVELAAFDPGASGTSVGMDDGDRDDQVFKWASFGVL